MTGRWSVGAAAAGLVLMLAQSAVAASFAVLVGVSDYDDSTGIADLRGPVNDVLLLRDTLSARGAFDVTILADGIEGAARPTRNAILGAFAELEARVASGDFVYIHMSGHGTQQPDTNGDESDGLDEVFLPADAAKAPPGSRAIPNAIVDEEIGAAVAALRARGADVWFVLDSCHSGSGLRAGSADVATRFVDPETLGIDARPSARDPSQTTPLDGPGAPDLPGKYLAFYAAQSSELARELEIDPDAVSGNGWYGLFTSRLAARLSQNDTGSYRQLFQAVLSDMGGAQVPSSARLQTPLWEGNLIDAAIFGGADTIGIRQFQVSQDTLTAGLLHGISAGTLVALVDDAAAAADARLGVAQVVSATAQTARLAPVADTCVAAADPLCPALGAMPANARFARVLARPVAQSLRIGVPVDLTTGLRVSMDHPLHQALLSAVTRVNETGEAQVALVKENADVTAGVFDDALWFGTNVITGDSPIGLAWRPTDDTELEPLLQRIFAAERVARMLDSVGGGTSVLFGNPVTLTLQMRDTSMKDRPRQLGTQAEIFRECEAALQSSESRQIATRETLNQCDQIVFGAQGAFQGPARDVNRVYIDSQFCVETAYARVEGTTVPARVGQPLTVCADCPNGDGIEKKAGYERLFMVVTEAQDNAEALDLRGLLETCTDERSSDQTRSAGGQAIGFLESLGKRTGMRGNLGGVGISNLWVERYDWIVLPRAEAFAREGLDAK